MGYTVNSIEIAVPAQRVFEVTNDPKNWVQLMQYKAVEVLERTPLLDGKELIRFRITQDDIEDGKVQEESWVSHRVVDTQTLRARGVRETPLFPFRWWILDISYEALGPGRTRMTWTQDFSIDPATGHTDQEVEQYVNKGSVQELSRVRTLLEQRAL